MGGLSRPTTGTRKCYFFGRQGYRVIAHDRRGHGRSTQTWDGTDMNTYADDLAALFDHLDLKDAIMVGHPTGRGEVAHYLGRHGAKRLTMVGPWGLEPQTSTVSKRLYCARQSTSKVLKRV
jgi:pimeloyl-ACP methyl ester carboxylesterase